MDHKEFFKKNGDQKIKLFQGGGYITVEELYQASIARYKDEKKAPKKTAVVEKGSDI